MKKYKVSKECIGCRACVEVAGDNFEINDDNIAYLKKQPTNAIEFMHCDESINICPVDAISTFESDEDDLPDVILAKSNIKETLDKHPELKQVLIELSPKFKRMQKPALYNTLARFANFNDAAKITGLSVCEILHVMNGHLGVEFKLLKSMPECINKAGYDIEDNSVEITWDENPERYIYNNDTVEELVSKVSNLAPKQNIVVISVEKPNELLKVASGIELIYNIEKTRDYRVSIFNPEEEPVFISWEDRKDDFEVFDVRELATDPFDAILKKSSEIKDDDGFILIQRFEPKPMINMLTEMGFEHITNNKSAGEVWTYLHKKVSEINNVDISSAKIDAVIQSATPVAYPVIMRLLQSDKITEIINIKELKVWEETEKHLAWISSGRADISFSALITSAKLRNSDIKIPALFVWDNFVLLTRYKANGFEDVKGKEIYTPLFEEAPPAKITKYLIEASGLNPDDFSFVFGKPFGRPEEIYKDFVTGKADTVILREPEASYAIKIMEDRGEDISIISYNKLWNEINPGFGSFPNAGIVLKGEFARKYPEQTKVFLEELKLSINWVNKNRKASAELSFEMMRQSVDRVELFLDRVNFEYVDGNRLKEKVEQYFDILNKNKIVDVKLDEEFFDIFTLD